MCCSTVDWTADQGISWCIAKLRLNALLPGASEAPSAAAAALGLVPAAQPQSAAVARPPQERVAAQGRPPRPKADAIDPMDPVSTPLHKPFLVTACIPIPT